MKTKWTVLLTGALLALAPAQTRAGVDLRPLVSTDIHGNLHIYQHLPGTCSNVNEDTPVIQGRVEIAPAEDAIVVDGQRLFMLTRASLSFAPFHIERHCMGEDEVRDYTDVRAEVAGAVTIRATEISPLVYSLLIPKDDVVIYEASLVNGRVETGYKHPKEDITGTLNLGARTVELVVKVETAHDFGWPFGTYHGLLTATISGTIPHPDTDGDGVPNNRDTCRLLPNPDQSAPVASPVIRAPIDLTLPSCRYRSLGQPAAADLCEGGGLTIFNDAPSQLPVGTTTVTWTARDVLLRTATDTQQVTVVDTTPPAFLSIPSNLTLSNCGPANLGTPTGFDDCDLSLTFTNNAPGSFPRGVTVVTWTATDDSGNQVTAAQTQTVTVNDAVQPSVSCSALLASPGYYQASGSDACGLPSLRLGSFGLSNPETIKLVASATPGVRFLGYDTARRRIFEVGPGANVVRATDAAGNTKSATCSASKLP